MEKINESIGTVLDFLERIPLSISTVNDYKTRYCTIRSFCKSNGITVFSYSDARIFTNMQKMRCISGQIGERHLRRLRRTAFLLEDCMQGVELTWKNYLFPDKLLNNFFANILNEYEVYLSDYLSSRTIRGTVSMIRQFLFFIEDSGLHDFTLLASDYVKHFMQNISKKNSSKVADYTWSVKKFILFLNESNLLNMNADRYLLRPVPSQKKVLPCFTQQDLDEILSSVDTTTALGKRDFAILKLAIMTGLRAVDIFGLRLVDIDWRKCEIYLVQSKTGEPLKLPLLPDVGNAVADYILNARPESDNPYIFLRSIKPHIKLESGCGIINKYLSKAGIIHEAWDGKTFHAFRRTKGTRLLEAEVPLYNIAEILGHKDLDSTKRYIFQSEEKLRCCCLDISEFATRKEGLI